MLDTIQSHVSRYATKSVDREALVIIIYFEDRTHGLNSLLILIECTQVVKRSWN